MPACLLVAALAAASEPGQVTGSVTVTRDGAPADPSGVVLYLVGFTEPPPQQPAQIQQHDKRFDPDLLPVTAGQTVGFPNQDPFFHNVFSLSPTRKFDLGQYPKGESKTKLFPSVGVVDVYCNIHPEMAATILVLPNRRFTRAGRDGSFHILGVPPGRWTLYAYSRRATAPLSLAIEITSGRSTEARLKLQETGAPTPHLNKYGEQYRQPGKYR
jgi:plastocyanin